MARIAFGVSENFILSELFELRTDKTRLPASPSEQFRNVIIVNQFGFNIGNPEKTISTISIGIFGQTDDRLQGRNNMDFTLSYIFTSVL